MSIIIFVFDPKCLHCTENNGEKKEVVNSQIQNVDDIVLLTLTSSLTY